MRAQVEHGILFWIGLVIGVIVLIAMFNLAAKLWGIIAPKEEPATLDSFKFLGQQLGDLREGEQRQVPYHIGRKYTLASGIPNCPSTKLCLCQDAACEEIVEGGIIAVEDRQFMAVQISGKEWVGVENLEIQRSSNRIGIRKVEASR